MCAKCQHKLRISLATNLHFFVFHIAGLHQMKSQKRSQVRRQHRCQEPKGTLSTFIILDGRGENYPIHMNRQKCNRILDNFSLKVLKVQAWGNLYSIWKGVKKESWKLKKTRPFTTYYLVQS